MSYKERLEIIKKYLIESIKDGFLVGATEAALNTERVYGDIKWLIEHAEKAEKYREALEFYANEKSWMNREVTILMDGEPTDVEDCPAIFDDGGNIARKALEGTE